MGIKVIQPEDLPNEKPDYIIVSSYDNGKQWKEELVKQEYNRMATILEIYEELEKEHVICKKEFYKKDYIEQNFYYFHEKRYDHEEQEELVLTDKDILPGEEKLMSKKGCLYWITGLSGAGKTTISTLLYNYLKTKQDNIILIDGDKIREVYQNTDYTEKGREKISYMNMRLCKMLTDQGIDVIIAVIGMRHEYREWNRAHIKHYCEIYLEVPMAELIQRDSKQIYSRALRKELTNVYGIDISYEEPKTPDVHIINDSSNTPDEVCQMIVNQLNL